MSVKVFFSAFFIAQFTSSCSNECRIRIAPNETIASLNGSSVTVQCTAYNCGNVDIKVDKENAHCTPFEETSEGSVVTNCSSIVGMADNGSFIRCYNQVDGSQSAKIELLVQGTIERVTRFDISKSDIDSCNISWGPVFAYEQLTVYYNITLNEIFNTTTNTWTVFDTSGLDSCQFARLNITSFINTTDQTLDNTSQWSIPIETPPTINDLKYVMTMNKNGSVLLNITLYFNLTDCVCPGRTNEVFCTVKNENISYSDTAKVVSDTNCAGYATFMLPPYIRIDAEIMLSNHFGTTNSGERLFFDTNPLRNITYERNSSSPIVQFTCIFIDDVMVTNQYSTGCLYYYKMAMGKAARKNNKAIANFTLNAHENFSICGLSIPSPDRCINSSETDSTMSSSSTTHENNWFSWMSFIIGFIVGVVVVVVIGGLIRFVVILRQKLQLLASKLTAVAPFLVPRLIKNLIAIQSRNRQQKSEPEVSAVESGLGTTLSQESNEFKTALDMSHINEDGHVSTDDLYTNTDVHSDQRQNSDTTRTEIVL